MGILHGIIFQALLLVNEIAVLLYSISSNRWKPSVSSPAFTTGYGWSCYSYGHSIGLDSTVR
jgi:hypothetical protein